VALVAFAVMIAVAIWLARRPLDSGNSEPLTALPFTSFQGISNRALVSPDGSRIAFAWTAATITQTANRHMTLYVKGNRQRNGGAINEPRIGMDQFHVVAGTERKSHFIAWPGLTTLSTLYPPWAVQNANCTTTWN